MSIHAPTSFDQLPLSEPIHKALAEIGYETPTDVQGGVIPLVLAGIDLIVQSQTGTGKTAAFAIPALEMLDADPGRVQLLALAPTRELALQVTREFEHVGGNALGLHIVTVYGGASISDQIRKVKSAEVVVATPGRCLDLLRRKAFSLEDLRIFVLDEADEMLSMGFDKEVRAICEYLPEERQSLMFSATVTESIRDMAGHILSYPEFVSFSSDSIGAEEVDHYYYMVQGVGRLRDLQRVLMYEEPNAALIFCNTRDDTFRVANYLKRLGFDSDVLNGDMPQSEREQVMNQMKAGKLRFLVATDVAARGIDISFLPCVINFVLPESADSYIHRTGRTGRAGRAGEAISLISPREIGMFYQLRRAYKFDLVERKLPSDEDLVALRQRRALERILDGLDADEDLDYGRYLTFAEAFNELPEATKRLAKLLAFFERSKQRVEAVKQAAAETEPEAEPEAEAEVEVEAEAEAPAEVAAETVPAPEADDAEADAAPADAPQAGADGAGADEEPGEPRRSGRRRRRRRSRGRPPEAESSSGDASAEAEEPAETKRRGSGGGRRRSRRRRRSGRDRQSADQSPAKADASPKAAGVLVPGVTPASMTSIRVNLGRDKVDSPERLVALLADLSGMGLEDLGNAQIFDDHSTVEVRDDLADDIILAIDSERLGDHELSASR